MGRVLPILFDTDMVRAILDGRKTVTRRICKDANDYTVPDMDFYDASKRTYAVHNYADKEHRQQLSIAERRCPICPGDILYVQETWKIHALNPSFCMMIRYKADNFCNIQVKFSPSRFDKFQKFYEKNGWQSPYFMPKEAARIWLKVTDVRVERLQDINDVYAEGIRHYGCPTGFTWKQDTDMHNCYTSSIGAMEALWNSTIKKTDLDQYGWDANPWVWVIEFERCEKPEDKYEPPNIT